MWKLLGSVVTSFLLLRDIFGYLLPGAVFVAGLLYAAGQPAKTVNGSLISGLPNWIPVVVGSYLIGQVLAVIGYGLYEIWDKPAVTLQQIKDLLHGKRPASKAQNLDESEALYYRALYPSLFIEADRRGTVNVLRIALAVALILSPWWTPEALRIFMFVVGILMLINGYTGRNHVSQYRAQTLLAARMMDDYVKAKEERRQARKAGVSN